MASRTYSAKGRPARWISSPTCSSAPPVGFWHTHLLPRFSLLERAQRSQVTLIALRRRRSRRRGFDQGGRQAGADRGKRSRRRSSCGGAATRRARAALATRPLRCVSRFTDVEGAAVRESRRTIPLVITKLGCAVTETIVGRGYRARGGRRVSSPSAKAPASILADRERGRAWERRRCGARRSSVASALRIVLSCQPALRGEPVVQRTRRSSVCGRPVGVRRAAEPATRGARGRPLCAPSRLAERRHGGLSGTALVSLVQTLAVRRPVLIAMRRRAMAGPRHRFGRRVRIAPSTRRTAARSGHETNRVATTPRLPRRVRFTVRDTVVVAAALGRGAARDHHQPTRPDLTAALVVRIAQSLGRQSALRPGDRHHARTRRDSGRARAPGPRTTCARLSRSGSERYLLRREKPSFALPSPRIRAWTLVDAAALGPAEEIDLVRIADDGSNPFHASALRVCRPRFDSTRAPAAGSTATSPLPVSSPEERARHLALATGEPDEQVSETVVAARTTRPGSRRTRHGR